MEVNTNATKRLLQRLRRPLRAHDPESAGRLRPTPPARRRRRPRLRGRRRHYDDEIVVTADGPGFETDDFDIAVDGDLLTVRADAEMESEVDEDAYVRRERGHRAMRRTIRLPVDVDGEGAATYRNGVLTVSIPVETGADVLHIDVE